MPSDRLQSSLTMRSQPCPTARDPYKQCQASTSLQQTSDRSKQPSRNNAPQKQFYLSRPPLKQPCLYQTLSALRAEHSHRYCPLPSCSLRLKRLEEAEA